MTTQPGAPAPRHAALVARLDAAAERLTTRVLDEMYADPFWRERFGERADRHGRQDGRFHIDYVIEALRADDVAIIENYARWLQQVLTSRGMATRHLAENFERLAAAIRDGAWPDGAAACALLDAACAALAYPAGPARAVQAAAPALAKRATALVIEADEDSEASEPDELASPSNARDVALLAIYAADALALDEPAVFARHIAWLAGFVERHGGSRAQLAAQLTALAVAADQIVPEVAGALRRILEPARAQLASHHGAQP